jgi:peptide/nickel transport system substrate-binding protein
MRTDLAPVSGASPARMSISSIRRPLAIAVLLVMAALAVAACGSSGSGGASEQALASGHLYGAVPPVGSPKKGGVISFGQLTGSTPTYIMPIVPGANASAYTNELTSNLYVPLYNGPDGATPEIDYSVSVANKPSFSDGDKTVTIPLKTTYKWSNGAPVDANDVIFAIDLLKAAVKESAANWGQYTPGEFPSSVVSATTKGKYTVVLHLNRAYNPGFFLNNQLETTQNFSPMPSTAWNIASAHGPHLDYTNPANAKKIYDFLSKAGGQVAQFGTNPLWKDVDGPFTLKSFNATNSSYTLAPNPSYGGSPKPYASQIQVQTFTGITPELNALRTGSLDIGLIDFSQLGQVPSLKAMGYSVFGYPTNGWFGAIINYKDKAGHFDKIISQSYVRQALAHLENEPAYVKGIFKNAAVPSYGPIPIVPKSRYTPKDALTPPYPFSPAAAVSLLRAHGWHVVPGGQTTCAKAGTAADECGAGIPAGTPFKFSWFYIPPATTPSSSLMSEAFASEAKQAAGINIQLEQRTFNYEIANFNDADPSNAKNENQWGVADYGGVTYDFYPTSDGVFNTGGQLNAGDYSDPTADKLIEQSKYSPDPSAVTNEGSYLAKSLPLIFQPNSDYIYAVSKRVGGQPKGFLSLTQLSLFPQFWYVKK